MATCAECGTTFVAASNLCVGCGEPRPLPSRGRPLPATARASNRVLARATWDGRPICQACGAQPAIRITARRQVGMILFQHAVRSRPTLCREHGLQFVNDYLEKTLIQGWWGVFAFFMNIVTIATDVVAITRLRKLSPSVIEDTDALPRAG